MGEINQQLIAERLQISRATVSRCFTNHPGINPITRAKVFQIAAEIGYTYLEKRTNNGKKKTSRMTFGVLICSDEEEHSRNDYQNPSENILAGISECAQVNGAKMEVHLVDPKALNLADESYQKIEKIRRRWCGMLLVYPFPNSVLQQLAPVMPIISLVGQFNHSGIDCVDVDHYKGISTAIEKLVEQGHQKIGFYTRRYQVEASWSFRRYSAFIEKMTRHCLPISPKDVINVFPAKDRNDEESYDYAAERTRAGVTAWLCAADHQAYSLVRGLQKRGIKVPDMASVIGFDGISPPQGCPQLTTIQIPFREIGATGTQRLIERIRRRYGSAHHVLIDCQFLPGKSVAQAP